MPGSKSNYFERGTLDWAFPPASGGTSYSPPSTLYVALCTGTAPTNDPSTTTEPSGGSYARVAINNGGASSVWGAASTDGSGVTTKTNVSNITFPQATANWGTITWFAILDASTGGNIIIWGTLTSPVTINSGDTAVFQSGGITIQED